MAVAPWLEILEKTWLEPNYRADLRTSPPDVFVTTPRSEERGFSVHAGAATRCPSPRAPSRPSARMTFAAATSLSNTHPHSQAWTRSESSFLLTLPH